MSQAAHEAHENMLAVLLADEEDPRRAFDLSPLSACEACVAEFDELLTLADRFSVLGREERLDLAAALGGESQSGTNAAAEGTLDEARVLRAFHAEVTADVASRSVRGPGMSGRWALRVAIAALVAASVIIALRAQMHHDKKETGASLRMGEGVRALHPVGEVREYTPFRWEGVPAGVRVRLRIFDRMGEALPEDGLVVDLQGESSWDSGPNVSLPPAIRWMVELYDIASDDNLIATSRVVEASLLPGGR